MVTLVLFPFLANACGGEYSSGSYTFVLIGGAILLVCAFSIFSIFFKRANKKIKKIAILLSCEIGGLPLLLALTYIYFRIKNAKLATHVVVNEFMNSSVPSLPVGSFYSIAANLITWYIVILVGVGFIGVIVNSILWIVFRKSEKKLGIKNLLIYSITSIFFGLLFYALWNASQSTLCGTPSDVTF